MEKSTVKELERYGQGAIDLNQLLSILLPGRICEH
jgi:hypothetical protein